MAEDPLDEWREAQAEDRRRAGLLPKGQAKNSLNKKLREMKVILEVVGALPENQPFRCRVEDIARLMKETSSSKAKERDGVKEFAACVKIAGSMKRRQAARWTPSWRRRNRAAPPSHRA